MLSRGKNSQAVSSYVDGDPSEQVYAPMVASDHRSSRCDRATAKLKCE